MFRKFAVILAAFAIVSLLLAWSRFSAGHDHSPSEIWARTSGDGGYTWGRPIMLSLGRSGDYTLPVEVHMMQRFRRAVPPGGINPGCHDRQCGHIRRRACGL